MLLGDLGSLDLDYLSLIVDHSNKVLSSPGHCIDLENNTHMVLVCNHVTSRVPSCLAFIHEKGGACRLARAALIDLRFELEVVCEDLNLLSRLTKTDIRFGDSCLICLC